MVHMSVVQLVVWSVALKADSSAVEMVDPLADDSGPRLVAMSAVYLAEQLVDPWVVDLAKM